MYGSPPSFQEFTIATNAAANTGNQNIAIVAAPGAGFALRIVGVGMTAARNTTGIINGFVHAAAAGRFLDISVSPQMPTAYITIPEPGIQLPANTALQMDNISNIATQTYTIYIYFFTDAI